MASAGERLQVLLTTKNEISDDLKRVKSEMDSLGRTSRDLHRRMEAGETGLQHEYEQTRREIEKNRLEQLRLGRAASETKSDIRKMTTEGTAGAKRMDRSMSGLSNQMGKTRRASSGMTVGLGKMIGVIAGVTAAIGAATGAWRFFASSIEESRQARKAAAQTLAVLKSMGRTEKPKALEDLINQLEAASGIDGDNIRETTNILLTFGNVTDTTFTKANKLALDLSVAFGKDLTSSAVMVGKALNDPTKGLTALTRVGVSFTEQQTEQVKAMMEVGDIAGAQKIILGELTRQVKGSAAEQADDIDKISVAWGNFKESVGEVLVSGVAEVMDALFPDTKNQKSPLVGFSKWLKQHQGEMVRGIVLIARSLVGLAQGFADAGSAMGGFLAWRLRVKSWTDIGISEEQRQAMRDEADAMDERNEKLKQGTAFLQDWLDKLDASATALDWQNKQVKTLRDTINGMKDKEVKIKIRATMKDVYQAVTDAVQAAQAAADEATRNLENRFAGGPVTSGGTYIVGELGPELFIPTVGRPSVIGADGPEIRDFRTAGQVIPNHLLATVTVPPQKQQQSPAPVSGGVHIEHLTVQDRWDARRELQSLMDRERRIAAERR